MAIVSTGLGGIKPFQDDVGCQKF
uniref:Uncharacterized protein n=1 Tax=Anguilla anguilla TaxID=7936 RepID=A0A0E9TKT3_ANGAN